MKNPILTILLFCSIINFSYSQKKVNGFPIPPNGIHLYDNIFIDQTEMANIHYLEFLFYIKDSSETFQQKCVLDTTVWKGSDVDVYEMQNHYFRNPSFRYYPVVGVSYDQAVLYCKWRSKVVSKTINENLKNEKFKVTYRLPTKKEWEFAAQGKLSSNEYPLGYKSISSNNEEYTNWLKFYEQKEGIEKMIITDKMKKFHKSNLQYLNLKRDTSFQSSNQLVTTDIYSGKRNTLKVYNMIGNIAEMLEEKERCKGGSWNHKLNQCEIKTDLPSPGKASWLGFRCIAVIEEL